ncbi:MAG: right-handed parallel beta-helix repeat-containing protein, partial [Candidatus Caldarchaeum sp.]
MRKRKAMWMLRSLVAVLILAMGLATTAALSPGELRVPQDYKTIQEAINAAKSGDTILVDPGTYVENLTITKREITIRGADPEKVIVQAKFADDPVVLIRERDVRISSLTLTGGSRGVQIDPRADTPVLSRLVVRANKSEGLFVEGVRSGELRDSLIAQNGKGVFVGSRAAFRLQGNRITQNQDGVEASDANRLELVENFVIENRGCGLRADEASADPNVLVGSNNIIVKNGQDLCGAAQNRRDILDQTPPPAPRNLTVTPAEWTNQGRFTVDWENPQDIAGITAYYFKVGSAPTGPTDGTRREISQKPLVIENPPEGEQPVFVWLEDGMGNKTQQNSARGMIKFDKTPPTGTLLINDGATRTTELVVTLKLQARDNASGLYRMRFSNDGRTWSDWEPFMELKRQWDLSKFGGSAEPGSKTVYAELQDQAGNVGKLQAQIEYIVARPPTASFTVTPANPRPGQPVTFDASASVSPNGKITKYAWDFGDGQKQETDRPIIQHTYAKEARYTVRLVITDVLGLTAQAERELPVEMKPATLRVPQDFFTIEEALAAAQPGDIILISPGVYSLNLVLDKSITLKGTDPTRVIVQGRDINNPVLTIKGEAVEVRLEALTITTLADAKAATILVQAKAKLTIVAGMMISNQGTASAVELAGSSQLVIEGTVASPVILQSEGGTAIQARDQTTLTISNAHISGKSGLALSNSAQATLASLKITASGGNGLVLSGSGSLSLTGSSSIMATGGDGLAFNSTGIFTLTNVQVTATRSGISIQQAAQATISGIQIKAGGDGLSFAGSGTLNLANAQVTAGKAAVRLTGSGQATFDLAGSTLAGDEASIVLGGTAKLTSRKGTIRGGIGVDVGEQAQLTLEEATVSGGLLDLRVIQQARARVMKTKLSGGLAGVLAGDSAFVLLQENEITDHPFWGAFLPTPACRPEPSPPRTLSGHTNWVFSVAFSPDGRLLASGSWQEIKLWEVGSGQLVRTLSGHTDEVHSVAFSPDGRLLASGSRQEIKLWDVASGREVRTLSGHTSWVTSVAFSPDGRLLASGSWDATIKLWDVASGREVRTLKGHTYWVESVAFSPDGRLLASGGCKGGDIDDRIQLWDVSTGQRLRLFQGHTACVTSVAFSPDGRLLASGSEDKTIKLWEVGSGSLVRTLSGHTDWVRSIAFSPDGRLLASGSDDKTIKLWEVGSGQVVRTLSGHTNWVFSV